MVGVEEACGRGKADLGIFVEGVVCGGRGGGIVEEGIGGGGGGGGGGDNKSEG
jgi:hypothetical protein